MVTLQCKGLEAWDERFDHIDDCHFKKGEKIDEGWYPLESDIPKGLLRNENVLDSGGPSTAPDESDTESSDEAQPDSSSPDEVPFDAPTQDKDMETESDLSIKQLRLWYCVSYFYLTMNSPLHRLLTFQGNSASAGRVHTTTSSMDNVWTKLVSTLGARLVDVIEGRNWHGVQCRLRC